MTFRVSIFALSLCALSICACSNRPATTNNDSKATPSAAAATPDAFAEVRAIYAKDCQSCHAADGQGGRVKLEDGKTLRVPSLSKGHALRHADADFRRQIIEGGDGMPGFKDKLSAPQVDEMIRFIRQEFQPGHTPPTARSQRPEIFWGAEWAPHIPTCPGGCIYNSPYTIYDSHQ